ncbi:hypothetical protein ACFCVU_27960 [Peribacillus butanolivorans]|uniref:hypothetical protein n=1 Tax=Peribacillus butanolivorans TaxID=421767 RepID=UPI0035DF59D6
MDGNYEEVCEGQLILSIIVAIDFIYTTFSYIKFTSKARFSNTFFYFGMISVVYGVDILTQKYIQKKKK